MSLTHFLIVSVLLLGAGIMTLIVRRNALGKLMGIELIISSAALNLAVFNRFLPAPPPTAGPRLDGQIFALFIILTAALQLALALAIFLNLRASTLGADKTIPESQRPDVPLNHLTT